MFENEFEGIDYDERLTKIRGMVANTNRAAAELEENLKYITENEDVINKLITKNSTNSVPLEQSKHKEFVMCVTKVVDFLNNWDQYAEVCMGNNALKPVLQRLEAALKENDISLKVLERKVAELQGLSEDIDKITEKSDATSL